MIAFNGWIRYLYRQKSVDIKGQFAHDSASSLSNIWDHARPIRVPLCLDRANGRAVLRLRKGLTVLPALQGGT